MYDKEPPGSTVHGMGQVSPLTIPVTNGTIQGNGQYVTGQRSHHDRAQCDYTSEWWRKDGHFTDLRNPDRDGEPWVGPWTDKDEGTYT